MSKNIRPLWFFARAVCFMFAWMNVLGTGWLLLRLSGSSTVLGAFLLLKALPGLALLYLLKVWLDSRTGKAILVVASLLGIISGIVSGSLYSFGLLGVTETLVLSVVTGFALAFDFFSRDKFYAESFGSAAGNGVEWDAISQNIGRLLGMGLGGLLIRSFGEGLPMYLQGAGFLCQLLTLLLVKYGTDLDTSGTTRTYLHKRQRSRAGRIAALLLMLLAVGPISSTYFGMQSVVAKSLYDGDSVTSGYLGFGFGLGAFLAPFAHRFWRRSEGQGQLLLLLCAMHPLVGVILISATSPWIGIGAFAIGGFVSTLSMVRIRVLVMLESVQEYRDRNLRLQTVIYGLVPVLGFVAGGVIEWSGSLKMTLLTFSVAACLVVFLVATLLPYRDTPSEKAQG